MTGSFIIAGLGNPGAAYHRTRHNVGFDVLDRLTERLRGTLHPGPGDYYFSRHRIGETEVMLLKPMTFMNNSGRAIVQALGSSGISAAQLLVVVDDIALPLGRLRLRPKGTDGGHNGLASIIASLNTTLFMRLRCGIGRNQATPGAELADFVLSRFDGAEVETASRMIERAADAALRVVTDGLQKTMSVFNEEGNSPLAQNIGETPS